MDLKSKNKVDVSFNMASMTDMVFLLLIFFMLTSNFITPSGLPVNLPSSKKSNIVMQKVSVTISKDLQFRVNAKPVTLETIQSALEAELNGEEGVVVLHIDKEVPVEYFVKVAGIATELKAKVSIAAIPEK
jgi:biopolymer transport protein ExbD